MRISEKIKRIISHSFFKATFWMFLGTMVINVGNYLYHLLTGKLLGRELYGALESLISLLYMISIPLATLNLVIVKYVSKYKGKKEMENASRLYNYFTGKILTYGAIFAVVLMIFSPLIMSFLHLSSPVLVVLLAGNFLIGLLTIINRSFLQGMSNFFGYAVSNAAEAFPKVILTVVVILLGFKVEGAFGALAIAVLCGGLSAYYFIHKYKFTEKGFHNFSEIAQFSLPVFLNTLGITSLITTDVILARHFFSAADAGSYAALSVLGKVIFFGVAPIMLVMFPFVSEYHSKGEKYLHIVFISFFLTLLGAAFVTAVYFLIPDPIILLLFNHHYVSIAPYLGLFGIFIGLYALCNLLSNFYLSIQKVKVAYIILIAAILQIGAIITFHSNILQVITINITITVVLLLILLLYYPISKRMEHKK